jgi:drug/metabolite transporter (DMT)-like permease
LSQIGTVAAVFGTVVAVFLLGEALPPNLALSGVLVAAGMVIFHRFTPKPKAIPGTD